MSNDNTIILNNQTVGNMKKYLDQFPDDAKMVIATENGNRDCQIASNFDNQIYKNCVMLINGMVTDDKGFLDILKS